jgi:hypothetical protein
MWCRTASTNRPVLIPLATLGFLGAKKVNEVRVPVVQYLVSQRAGSIQALVTYFVVPRLRYFPRISQHRRLARYAQPEPNEDTVGSRWKVLCKPASLPVALLNRKPSKLRAALVLPRALWSGGSGFAAHGSGRALAPVHLVAPSLCPEKPGPGLCFLPRNFPGWPWNPA